MDNVSWIERVVRLEERLSALTARVDKLEDNPADNPELIECITEIGELLAEALGGRTEDQGFTDPLTGAPSALHNVVRRGVYVGFAALLFIISKLLEPGGDGFVIKLGG